MKNWDLWQSVLVAARAGSVGAAAVQLNVNPTTLSRKIKRLETTINQVLFHRQGVTLKPTGLCLSLLPQLEQAASRLNEIESRFIQIDHRLPRKIRISTIPFITNQVLAPRLDILLKGHNLQVELMVQTGNIHLTRREADIAIRLAKPDQPAIHAENIATIHYHPVAKRGVDPDTLLWASLGSEYAHLPEAKWTMNQSDAKDGIHYATQTETLLQMVKSGIAKAMLPDLMTKGDPDLVCIDHHASLYRHAWLLKHRADKGIGYIEHTADWIKQSFESYPASFRSTKSSRS